MWYEISLKVINVRFGNFNSNVHRKNLKRGTYSKRPLLILTTNASIKYNFKWYLDPQDWHVMPVITCVHYDLGVKLVVPYIFSCITKYPGWLEKPLGKLCYYGVLRVQVLWVGWRERKYSGQNIALVFLVWEQKTVAKLSKHVSRC